MIFHKVSKDQFITDCGKFSYIIANNCYDEIKIPRRATKKSAGYDFYMPFPITLRSGGTCTIPTGIKLEMPSGYFLMIVPRSGLGFKYRIGLANTVGIIDGDYFNNPDNEGHIMVRLVNNGPAPVHISMGGAFCQGIILPYFLTDDDDVQEERSGGLGSTDKEHK